MKNPLTQEAYRKFKTMSDELSYELRLRRRMRYGKTIRLLEAMLDLMILDRSWERRKSRDAETDR